MYNLLNKDSTFTDLTSKISSTSINSRANSRDCNNIRLKERVIDSYRSVIHPKTFELVWIREYKMVNY